MKFLLSVVALLAVYAASWWGLLYKERAAQHHEGNKTVVETAAILEKRSDRPVSAKELDVVLKVFPKPEHENAEDSRD